MYILNQFKMDNGDRNKQRTVFSELCKTLGPLAPPELDVNKESKLLRQLFLEIGASKGLIESFDYWLDYGLPQQIASKRIRGKNGYVYFTNTHFSKPYITIGGKQMELTPQISEDKSYTYSGEIKTQVYYIRDDGVKFDVQQSNKNKKYRDNSIFIGSMPIMVKSKYC